MIPFDFELKQQGLFIFDNKIHRISDINNFDLNINQILFNGDSTKERYIFKFTLNNKCVHVEYNNINSQYIEPDFNVSYENITQLESALNWLLNIRPEKWVDRLTNNFIHHTNLGTKCIINTETLKDVEGTLTTNLNEIKSDEIMVTYYIDDFEFDNGSVKMKYKEVKQYIKFEHLGKKI